MWPRRQAGKSSIKGTAPTILTSSVLAFPSGPVPSPMAAFSVLLFSLSSSLLLSLRGVSSASRINHRQHQLRSSGRMPTPVIVAMSAAKFRGWTGVISIELFQASRKSCTRYGKSVQILPSEVRASSSTPPRVLFRVPSPSHTASGPQSHLVPGDRHL